MTAMASVLSGMHRSCYSAGKGAGTGCYSVCLYELSIQISWLQRMVLISFVAIVLFSSLATDDAV